MARTRKSDDLQKPFAWTDEKVITSNSTAPQVRARKQALLDPEARGMIANAITSAVQACKMPRVNSNADLIERLEQFFNEAAKRQTYPTVEEMALYCGYSASTLRDWRTGRISGFTDRPDGMTTSEIITRALDVLHAVDAVLASAGKINGLIYIFRSHNYYGMRQKQEIEIAPREQPQSMTREQICEIAMNLPDAYEQEGI